MPTASRTLPCPERVRVVAAALSLAAVSGLLYRLAYPPFDVWPLAFVSLAPLLVALNGRSARRAFVLGGVQGLVAAIACSTWLPEIVRTFGSLPWVVCDLIALAFCAWTAGRTALFAWLAARAAQNGWPRDLAVLLAFGATEALYPLLFPWYAAAQVHGAPLFLQLAELGGPVLVGVALVMASVAGAELVLARLETRAPDRRRLGLALLGPAAMVVFGAWRIPILEREIAAAPEASIGIVQANVPHSGATLTDALAAHRQATARLQATDSRADSTGARAVSRPGKLDLVIWPETALAGIVDAERIEATLGDSADDPHAELPLTVPILAGALLRRGDAITNSAVLFADRRVRGVYDKTHPLAFGEYIPFGDVFPSLYSRIPNAGRLTAGTSEEPLVLGDHRISPLICYEDILAGSANRAIAHADPDLLVNMTNDAWFGDSPAASIHLALATLRAVEHRRYLVRATNSGRSAFIDPIGRVSGTTPMFEQAAEVETVRWMRSHTLYERTGDAPWWLAAIAVAIMAFAGRARFALHHSRIAPAQLEHGSPVVRTDRPPRRPALLSSPPGRGHPPGRRARPLPRLREGHRPLAVPGAGRGHPRDRLGQEQSSLFNTPTGSGKSLVPPPQCTSSRWPRGSAPTTRARSRRS